MKSTATIRVYMKDWNMLRRIFPSERGESLARYLERYIQSLKDTTKLQEYK